MGIVRKSRRGEERMRKSEGGKTPRAAAGGQEGGPEDYCVGATRVRCGRRENMWHRRLNFIVK